MSISRKGSAKSQIKNPVEFKPSSHKGKANNGRVKIQPDAADQSEKSNLSILNHSIGAEDLNNSMSFNNNNEKSKMISESNIA